MGNGSSRSEVNSSCLLVRTASGPHSVLQANWCEKRSTGSYFFSPFDHIVTVLFWFIAFIAIVSRCKQAGRQAVSPHIKDVLIPANHRGAQAQWVAGESGRAITSG